MMMTSRRAAAAAVVGEGAAAGVMCLTVRRDSEAGGRQYVARIERIEIRDARCVPAPQPLGFAALNPGYELRRSQREKGAAVSRGASAAPALTFIQDRGSTLASCAQLQ